MQHVAAAQGKCSKMLNGTPLVDSDCMCRRGQGAGLEVLQDLTLHTCSRRSQRLCSCGGISLGDGRGHSRSHSLRVGRALGLGDCRWQAEEVQIQTSKPLGGT